MLPQNFSNDHRAKSRARVLALMLGIVPFLFFGLGETAQAQQRLLQRNYDKTGSTRIEVESVFSPAVARGYLPVRVTIRNATPQNRTWNLEFDFGSSWGEMSYRSNFEVSADAGAETVQELLVPVPTSISGGSSYRQLTTRAHCVGLPPESQTDSSNYSADWPGIAISKKLADRNLSQLNSAMSGGSRSGADVFGATFDPATLPADWRAYTSLDVVMITDEEWKTASPSARLAILEWIRLGGRLDLYTRNPKPAEVLIAEGFVGLGNTGSATNRGLGKAQAWSWNGQDLNASQIVGRYRSVPNVANGLANDYRRDWPLLRSFGSKSFNAILVVLLLIVFGVVVGPINLFVLAKPGRRHRLFVTTPIISLIASLLILALILLSDGIGGSGRRAVLANLEPGANEKRLYVIQEQISRTGVLLGSGFQISEPAFVSPVMLPASPWNRLDNSSQSVASYHLNGNTFRGDWFQSRSEQGHYLQTVRPTRSRIELQAASPSGETPPKLFSSLEFTVDEFFYRDHAGQVWQATSGKIAGGEEIPLKPVNSQDLEKWWKSQTGNFSAPLRNRAKSLISEPDHFFATSTDSQAGFIDTLSSIRWKDDFAVIHGSILPASGVQPEADASEPPKNEQ